LNQKANASLIIVTHDSQLAQRAERILHLVDGVLTTQ
ncbi:MAG TPA: lipoprotein-releasing system ATP-binding protein LolD, partial [Nitrosomonas sp.]|nr:lipoprotein-releasing system ATP-binding protein LolD [Nitrosomonas sp.]